AIAPLPVREQEGGTDLGGNAIPPGSHAPKEDGRFLEEERAHWIAGIHSRNWDKEARRADLEETPPEKVLVGRLTGLGLSEMQIHMALREVPLDPKMARWSREDLVRLAHALRRRGKPMILAANKPDLASPAALAGPTHLDGER